jgi:Ca2+-binding RTX toxin-like protein
MAALAMLVAVSGVQAATIKMTSTGLVIDSTGDGDSQADFTISADERTPSGEISRWNINAFTCDPIPALGGTCLNPVGPACKEPGPGDPDFGTPFGSVVRCDRTAAGVKVLTGGGDDTVTLITESDPATVDLGAGNDQLRSLVDVFLGLRLSTGKWNVTGGPGNDVIAGSTGGNVIDGGSGNDVLKGFPVDQSFRSLRDRPDFSGDDSIFGGSGNDYIDAGNGSDSVSGGTATTASTLAPRAAIWPTCIRPTPTTAGTASTRSTIRSAPATCSSIPARCRAARSVSIRMSWTRTAGSSTRSSGRATTRP